jgi:hypothetical protein
MKMINLIVKTNLTKLLRIPTIPLGIGYQL